MREEVDPIGTLRSTGAGFNRRTSATCVHDTLPVNAKEWLTACESREPSARLRLVIEAVERNRATPAVVPDLPPGDRLAIRLRSAAMKLTAWSNRQRLDPRSSGPGPSY
jgi:hypothetical protein